MRADRWSTRRWWIRRNDRGNPCGRRQKCTAADDVKLIAGLSRFRDSSACLWPNLELRNIVEQAEDVYDPQDDDDHHNRVQDALDRPLHGNEAVDEPEKHADNQ